MQVEAELSVDACRGARHVVLLTHVAPYMGKEDEARGRGGRGGQSIR